MHRTSPRGKEWRRYKEVEVPWASYDEYRLNECSRILDLTDLFGEMDRPVRRREFRVSSLAVLLLFKILFNLSYRTIASANKDLGIYKALGMKRAPCYKTIQNTMRHLNVRGLERINRRLLPESTELASVDASGMKTTRRGAWVIVRFRRRERWRDFKKVHIFVDLVSKKIIHCLVTKGTSSDHPQLRRMLRRCRWMRIGIILGDAGYDTRECFNEIEEFGAIPGIKVRKSAVPRPKFSPARKRAVLQQRKDYDAWKRKVRYTMRCVVESIFSATKRRFGEVFFSIKESFRKVEMWLRTILWNVLIYPR